MAMRLHLSPVDGALLLLEFVQRVLDGVEELVLAQLRVRALLVVGAGLVGRRSRGGPLMGGDEHLLLLLLLRIVRLLLASGGCNRRGNLNGGGVGKVDL